MTTKMIVDFILGTIVGAGLVGSSVHRTLSVHKGEMAHTFAAANMNSVFYYFSVYFIAKDNGVAYLGTCLGSWAIVMYMSYKNRRKRGNQKNNPISDQEVQEVRSR